MSSRRSRARRLALSLTAVCAGTALLGGSAALAATAPAATGSTATSSTSTSTTDVPARRAADFLDSIGVVIHTDRTGPPYDDGTAIGTRVQELGLRHVRSHVESVATPEQTALLDALASRGIRLNAVISAPTGDAGVDQEAVDGFLAQLRSRAGSLDSVEGPNEVDLRGPTDWVPAERAYARMLWDALRGDSAPALRQVPVLAPSLVGYVLARDAPKLGSLTDVTTVGNVHSYPGTVPESDVLGQRMDLVRQYVSGPDAPVVVSETGYQNALNSTNRPGVPESVSATYLPRVLLNNFAAGAARTYVYELADEGARAGDTRTDDLQHRSPEGNFGLLHFDRTYKRSGSAVRALTTLLADPSPLSTPGSLRYGIAGAPDDLRQVLLQKGDGTYVLALWRPQSVWDGERGVSQTPDPAQVTVDLGAQHASFGVYSPSSGSTTAVSATTGSSTSVTVGADVALVSVDLRQAPPSDVTATPADASATVRWAAPPPGPSPVTGYRVTTSPGGATQDSSSTTALVAGLTNGTAYTFTVQALTRWGPSEPSAASQPVVPARPPGAPTAVVAEGRDGRAAVSWNPPRDDGGSPVRQYVVTSDPEQRTAQTDGTSVVVQGLTNGRSYRFTVVATSGVGRGPASQPSSPVVPHGSGDPGAPHSLTATAGDQRATVTWQPSQDSPAPTTSYVVDGTPTSGSTSPVQTTVSADTTSAEFVGLVNGVGYTFTVTASSGADRTASSSPSEEVVPAGLPLAPSRPTATTTGRTASVTWPASDGNGAPVQRYRVTVQPGGAVVESPSASATVEGLTYGTAYTFSVTATNRVGSSSASPASEPVVPSSAPGAPAAVTARGGRASATVTWSAPPDNGSPISSYTVTGSPGGSVTVPGSATTAVVPGLTNGTSYTFTVTAANDHGTSPASTASAPVVPATVPGRPTAVRAYPATSSALVRWTPPSDGGSPLGGYVVTASPGGLTARSGGGTTSATVPGLTNGTAYTFTVRAYNAVGNGTLSGASNRVVPTPAPRRVDDTDPSITYGGWHSVLNSAASAGAYSTSSTAGSVAQVRMSGSSLTWVTRTGPDQGQAQVQVDGVDKGVVDLYATRRGAARKTFRGLGSGMHTLSVTVLGTKHPMSSGTSVAVDGFASPTASVDQAAPVVTLDGWSAGQSSSADGGSFRSSGTADATVTLTFTGSGIDLRVPTGPAAGRVDLDVDGVSYGELDTYSPTTDWQNVYSYTGLDPKVAHTVRLRVKGVSRAASSGDTIVLDGFGIRP